MFASHIFFKGILFIALNLWGFYGFTQKSDEPKDTVPEKVWAFKTTQQLADTAWWALQQKTTEPFLSLLPTLKVINETFDSLEIKNNPQIIKIKYNKIVFRVTKQLKILNLKAKSNKLKFKTCEKDRVKIIEGKDEKGNAFAYISLESHKSKREFTIKFVALELNKNWYIVDELLLEFAEDNPYYKSPVKLKKK